MTTSQPPTTTGTDDTTLARLEIWRELADAVEAGCPLPVSLYIAKDAGLTTITVLDERDVAVWAARLGLPDPTVRVYPVDGGSHVQRAVETEQDTPWLNIRHLSTLAPSGDETGERAA